MLDTSNHLQEVNKTNNNNNNNKKNMTADKIFASPEKLQKLKKSRNHLSQEKQLENMKDFWQQRR